MTDGAPVRSVARATDILLALAQGPHSLARVAEATGLSKSTAHRLLASLGYKQLVVQDASNGVYLLGPGCFSLVDAVIRGLGGLGVLARPILTRLWDYTEETITLHVRVGTQRICAEEVVSPQPVRYTAGIGEATPIHSGSAGKLLLAFTEQEEREDLLDHLTLGALTDATITDRAALDEEIEKIRRRGFAESRGERVAGAAALSAPVFGADGRILAALSILGPDNRLTDVRRRELRPTIIDAAQEVSGRIAANGAGGTDAEQGGAT